MSCLFPAAGRMALAASLMLFTAASLAAPPQLPVDGLIVKLKEANTHERVQALGAEAEGRETARLARVMQLARVTEARTRPVGRAAQYLSFGRRLQQAEAMEMADRLRALPDVDWVDLNQREKLQQAVPTPTDPNFRFVNANDTGQWWLRSPTESLGTTTPSFGAPDVQSAWRYTTGNSSAVVAVLDTGTTTHPDLAGRFLIGYDFISDEPYARDGNGRDTDPSDPGDWVTQSESDDQAGLFFGCGQDSSWHGTAISGIVAASTNNGQGVAGVNWNGRVLPVRVAGKCGALPSDIVAGMRWAAGIPVAGAPPNEHPARIINISFGGSSTCLNAYQETIDDLTARNVVVVAAVGNAASGVSGPALCSGVISVGALARDGLKADYSNFGPRVVISTVGGDPTFDDGILTTSNTGTQSPAQPSYAQVYGTSFSAPIVSGVISLMLSANPNLTTAQIIGLLQATARPHVLSDNLQNCPASVPNQAETGACVCTRTTCGAGILDAAQAVLAAGGAPAPAGDGGGGGALGWMWLTGLGLAVVVLARSRSARGRAGSERLAE